MEATNLPSFLKFGNAKKSDIYVIFPKIMGGHKTEVLEQNWGACALPGPKTATAGCVHHIGLKNACSRLFLFQAISGIFYLCK